MSKPDWPMVGEEDFDDPAEGVTYVIRTCTQAFCTTGGINEKYNPACPWEQTSLVAPHAGTKFNTVGEASHLLTIAQLGWPDEDFEIVREEQNEKE